MTDPDMGQLDPAVAAELKRAVAEHHMDRAVLNAMYRELDELVSPEEPPQPDTGPWDD